MFMILICIFWFIKWKHSIHCQFCDNNKKHLSFRLALDLTIAQNSTDMQPERITNVPRKDRNYYVWRDLLKGRFETSANKYRLCSRICSASQQDHKTDTETAPLVKEKVQNSGSMRVWSPDESRKTFSFQTKNKSYPFTMFIAAISKSFFNFMAHFKYVKSFGMFILAL